MYYRLQTKMLLKYLKLFPVVAVSGPRQVGKSTLVQSKEILKAGHRKYYTLDSFDVLELAKNEPESLIKQEGPITIDEVQLCPELLVEIKKEVDKNREPGKYLLTGSADLSFAAGLSKVLAGRVGIIDLLPLSWWEIEKKEGIPWIISCLESKKFGVSDIKLKPNKKSLEDMILKGGYPPAALCKIVEDAHIWHGNYKQSYLERDIRQFTEILHISEFAKLLTLCSARTGRLLNQADLARDANLIPVTVARYLNLLEVTFQIKRLQPYFTNISKRQVKSPKLYWCDTGMATYLLGLNNIEAIIKNNLWGQILETYVIMQIETYLKGFKPSASLYFWRSHDGREIDGVITDGLNKIAFEVKASKKLSYSDANAIREFVKLDKHCKFGFIFYLGDEVTLLGKNIWGLPVEALLG